MILVLLFIGLIVGGIILTILAKRDIIEDTYGDFEVLFEAITCLGVLALIISFCVIIVEHSGTEVSIQKERIERDTLIVKLNKIDEISGTMNGTEIDISIDRKKSYIDVFDDVVDWNKWVISSKYWAKNPWTSWFYNQKVVDERQLIEIE